MMLFHASAPWALLAAPFAPLWLAALGLAASRWGIAGASVALVLGAIIIALILRAAMPNSNHLYVLQHVAFNAFFCAWFASTLRPGRPSSPANLHSASIPCRTTCGSIPPKVTRLWAAYFAAMVVASIAVYLTMSFSAWSLLANVLTPVCVVALFLGEHFARYRLHPEFERSRLMDVVRAAMGARPKGTAGR